MIDSAHLKYEHTSRLDAADDDVVDFIVSDLLVATSRRMNKELFPVNFLSISA